VVERLGVEVELVSAPEVAPFAGVGFLRALEEHLGRSVVADCGEDAGLIMAALRAGLRDVLFTGEERLRRPLAEMAEAVGGRLRTGLKGPVVALCPDEEPAGRLAAVVQD
jgi:hypothetical protein